MADIGGLALAWLAALGWAALLGWAIIALLIPSSAKGAGFTGRPGVMTIRGCYTSVLDSESSSATCRGQFVADDDSDMVIEVTLAGSVNRDRYQHGDQIAVRVIGDTARQRSVLEMAAGVWAAVVVGVVGLSPLGWLARRTREPDLDLQEGLATLAFVVFGSVVLCAPLSCLVTAIWHLVD